MDNLYVNVQSNPSIPPILGLAKKKRYSETAVLGVIYKKYKTHIWDLKMGGGIERAAVLGGAVLRGTTVLKIV